MGESSTTRTDTAIEFLRDDLSSLVRSVVRMTKVT
jgi:hypothetical protein